MVALSHQILTFFDDYRDGGDTMAFAREYGRLLGDLNRRWTREEVRLYPAWDSLHQERAA